METDGRYCQRKKGIKDNSKIFVLSNWVKDSGHVLQWERMRRSRLGELKNSVLNRLSLRCLLDNQMDSWLFESGSRTFFCGRDIHLRVISV